MSVIDLDREARIVALTSRYAISTKPRRVAHKLGKPKGVYGRPVRSDRGEEWPSVAAAAEELGVTRRSVWQAVEYGYVCQGRRISERCD